MNEEKLKNPAQPDQIQFDLTNSGHVKVTTYREIVHKQSDVPIPIDPPVTQTFDVQYIDSNTFMQAVAPVIKVLTGKGDQYAAEDVHKVPLTHDSGDFNAVYQVYTEDLKAGKKPDFLWYRWLCSNCEDGVQGNGLDMDLYRHRVGQCKQCAPWLVEQDEETGPFDNCRGWPESIG